ncbi:MAG: hypothetical protein HQK89_09150 [Nitrospirae bacterium]|nr:hypothetical protein [Nitrospirota bacterium]
MFKGKIIRDGNIELYGMPSLQASIVEDAAEGKESVQGSEVQESPAEPKIDLVELERQARVRAVDIEKEAYQKGFQAGQESGTKSGIENAGAAAKPHIDELSRVVEELKELKKKILDEVEPQVVDLAIAIARKTVAVELSVNPGVVLEIVKEALNKMEKIGTITIRVHPKSLELFENGKDVLARIHPEIVFETDQSIPLSGSHITSDTEKVITDVDELFDNVVSEMRDNLVIG